MDKAQALNELIDCYEASDSLDIPDLCERVWDDSIAHARTQIEAEARAAAVADTFKMLCLYAMDSTEFPVDFIAGFKDFIKDLATAPAGHKCVPLEVYSAMIGAGLREAAKRSTLHADHGGVTPQDMVDVCKAMLAARPK